MIPKRHRLLRRGMRSEVFLTGPGLAAMEAFPFGSCLRDIYWSSLSWEHAGGIWCWIGWSGGCVELEGSWISPLIVGTDIEML